MDSLQCWPNSENQSNTNTKIRQICSLESWDLGISTNGALLVKITTNSVWSPEWLTKPFQNIIGFTQKFREFVWSWDPEIPKYRNTEILKYRNTKLLILTYFEINNKCLQLRRFMYPQFYLTDIFYNSKFRPFLGMRWRWMRFMKGCTFRYYLVDMKQIFIILTI